MALAKQAIDEGRVGKIISMHARRNLSKRIGRMVLDKISALEGDGVHDADLMLWFSGAAPLSVYAQEVHPGPGKYPDGGWAPRAPRAVRRAATGAAALRRLRRVGATSRAHHPRGVPSRSPADGRRHGVVPDRHGGASPERRRQEPSYRRFEAI